jgi:hypothetical protein
MRTDYILFSLYDKDKSEQAKEVDMFPTQLELEVLHAERLREAEKYRLARSFSQKPSLLQRLFARLTTPTVSRQEEVPCYETRSMVANR